MAIYLDHSASTPVDPRVIEVMLPYWTTEYGNPSSMHHHGRMAAKGLEEARRKIAGILHAHPSEIIFTGCGSESDNLALRGAMWQARQVGTGNHLITCITEHEAVLKTAEQLRDQFGFDLTILGVDKFGQVDVAEVASAIRPDTVLISIMAANNEIGTIQPFAQIGALAREHGVLFHTDAVQAGAYVEWNMQDQPIDMMSLAPHKLYGPKGVGILYVRKGVQLVSTLTGGGQEEGRRAGTVNVPFAVGGAEAFRLVHAEREALISHSQQLRDRLIDGVLSAIPETSIQLTGHPTQRLPHHASFAVAGATGNDLLIHLDIAGISASSGSACATGNPEPSSTLQAVGLDDHWTKGGLRLTVGRQNTIADIDHVIDELPKIVTKVQALIAQFSL
jgi:cysteine desulfurase